METKKLLQKYYSRLVKEGLLKSLMMGLTMGFSVLLAMSAVWWFFGMKTLWICGIAAIVVAGISTPIFYYTKYRPTIRQAAQRVDALGLEERVVTMAQYENEETYIIRRQREDAKAKLSQISEKLLKVAISTSLIITLAVVGACGIGMTTAAAVSKKSGKEIFAEPFNKVVEYEITYEWDGDGEIQGEMVQTVEEGMDGSAVLAVPAEDWVFVKWSDGNTNPYRIDKNVREDKEIVAIFEMVEMADDPMDGEGDGNDGGDEEKQPSESQSGDGPSQPNPDGQGGDQGGMGYEPNHMVLDGKTYYGLEFEGEYQSAMESIAGNENISGEESSMIQNYYESINKTAESEGNDGN